MWLSLAGCAGMIFLLTRHYPVIFKVEQVLQLLVLAAIAVCVLHPEPGPTTRNGGEVRR